jgi:lysozyme
MRVSDKGVDLIKAHEGLRLRAYLCPAGVWTIGYGTTGPHVYKGLVITKAEAEAFLQDHLVHFEQGVLAAINPAVANQSEFDAMVSLCYNIGLANFRKSSVVRMFKAGNKTAAAEAFTLWVKAKDPKTGKKVPLPGLVRRRAEEKTLFLSGTEDNKVERVISTTRTTTVPEASVVPEAPKPLSKSREIIGGGVVGTGGLLQIINSLTVTDATELKKGVTEIKTEANGPFFNQIHGPEIAAALTVSLSMFIIWKRIKDRKEGVR